MSSTTLRSAHGPILVTGGAGFIGSHTCKLLSQNSIETIVVDNMSGPKRSVRYGKLIQLDLSDREGLLTVFREYKPSCVIHFAGSIQAGESVIAPDLYYRNNVANTLNLLEVMKTTQTNRIVFSSTCATYGIPHETPLTESHPQNPINPYGNTKLAIEMMIRDFGAAFNVQWIMLRYFNAAGADPEGELGECHEPETHLIPLVLRTALGLQGAMVVHGNDYPTPDGTCVRDYVHVVDLANAHWLAFLALINGQKVGAYNLGSETGSSVLEVIQAARHISGRPIAVKMGPRRPGDPPYLVGSSKLAKKELGWVPRWSELNSIVQHAWNWELKNHA